MLPNQLHLWPGRAVYRGQGYDSTPHRHHAAQLGVGLGGPLGLAQSREPAQLWAGFAVSPGVPHRVDSAGMETLFVWSESLTVSHALDTRRGLHPLRSAQTTRLATALGGNLDGVIGPQLDGIILEVLGLPYTPPALESRVQAALLALQSDSLSDQTEPLNQLAAQVGLSPSRLRHLFRQGTGVSLGNYLRWQRLLSALRQSAEGLSLTEAAHAAGFADSAHLSRFFRASFGLKPSEVLRSHSVQVFLHPER